MLTENAFGNGKAYYVGTRSSEEFYREFIRRCMEEKNIHPVLETPDGVEVTERFNGDRSIKFVLNHNDQPVQVKIDDDRKDLLTGKCYGTSDSIELEAKGVLMLEK